MRTFSPSVKNNNSKPSNLAQLKAEQIRSSIYDFCENRNLGFYFKVDVVTSRDFLNTPERIEIHIEPAGYKNKPEFDGLQIIYSEQSYEVSEYQAGPNNDNLYIYKDTPYLKTALKDFLKGNNRKPIKVW
jgi:hypothetical protein